MADERKTNEDSKKIKEEKTEKYEFKDFKIQDAPENSEGIEKVVQGRTTRFDDRGEEVFLRIYDLSQGMAKVISPQLLGFQIDGIWHTSIEIFGYEYYFQNGLVCQKAGTTFYGPFVDRVSLGSTECSKEKLDEFFEISKSTWTPESYNLFENNCNNFSDFLSHFLVEKGIPSHIIELPEKVKSSPAFKSLFRGGFK